LYAFCSTNRVSTATNDEDTATIRQKLEVFLKMVKKSIKIERKSLTVSYLRFSREPEKEVKISRQLF
jgi:hypothetical protein